MFDELIRKRASTRSYRSRTVDARTITHLLEAARLAPSSRNGQPWRFIVLDEKEMLAPVLSAGNEWVLRAPVVMTVLREKSASPFNVGLAVENMLLAATDRGLSGHVVGGFDRDILCAALQLPEDLTVECLLTFGYPESNTGGTVSERAPLAAIAFHGSLDNPWKDTADFEPEQTVDIPIVVRFRDLDAMGHVNNATYFTFMEEARIGFRDRIRKSVTGPTDFRSVVAENHLRYLRPITLGEPIVVRCWVSRLREKSYYFHYVVMNPDTGERKAIGYTVMVGFNYEAGHVEALGDQYLEHLRPYSV